MLLYRSSPSNLSCDIETPSRFRDWMTAHAYRCLPLTVANELGVDIICPEDVTYEWNGGADKADVKVSKNTKIADTHFGLGSLTFTLGYIWKIPKNLKKQLLFIPVPNDFDSRFTAMTALIEPDALTYPTYLTLKLTQQGKHTIAKGTRIGRVIIVDVAENQKNPVKILSKIPQYIANAWEKSRQARLEIIDEHNQDKTPKKRLWTRFYHEKAKYTKLRTDVTEE